MVIAAVDRIYNAPFEWGVSDCCTRACDVLLALHGVDPMGPLRGRYSGPAGAMRIIRDAGGWDAMCADLAARAGLTRGRGEAGAAVGLVEGGTLGGLLAVAVPGGWAAPVDCGSVIMPDVSASWGI